MHHPTPAAPHKNHKALRANLLLSLAAIIWGSTFIFQKAAMDHMSPLAFTGVRFLLGGLALAPFAYLRGQRLLAGGVGPALMVRWWVLGGLISGLLISVGMAFQQYGLVESTAGKAGFITGLYVVVVPIISRFLGRPLELGVGLAVILSVIGLYFLSFTGQGPFELGAGDGLILIGAFVWGAHVVAVGWLSPKMDSVVLAAGQALCCGLICLAASLLLGEGPTAAGIRAAWLDILWGGFLSVALGFTFQIMGQKDAPATPAAIIMQTETIVAAICGVVFLGEVMSGRMVFGAALMFTGMLLSQLWPMLSGAFGPPANKAGAR